MSYTETNMYRYRFRFMYDLMYKVGIKIVILQIIFGIIIDTFAGTAILIIWLLGFCDLHDI